MGHAPLLSFIVLSYNYEDHIVKTIRSILDQTEQDFEIVVVDDASQDKSCEVVNSFGDSRIRLIRNNINVGGAESYNRAVLAAKGEWLVNLDADDWIHSDKTAIQLEKIRADPSIDIIGSYVAYVDEHDDYHSRRDELEPYANHNLDLNLGENWIGRNLLCRSSTMFRRQAHLNLGLDDPTMIRAPDYELWTRALRFGCNFQLVPEALTFYRLHSRGITRGDARGTFLEMSYATLCNVIPTLISSAQWRGFARSLHWMMEQEEFAALTPTERYRLFAMAFFPAGHSSYSDFLKFLQLNDDPHYTELGRRCLAAWRCNPLSTELRKLNDDVTAYIEARDYWHEQSDRWEAECLHWKNIAQEVKPEGKKQIWNLSRLLNPMRRG